MEYVARFESLYNVRLLLGGLVAIYLLECGSMD